MEISQAAFALFCAASLVAGAVLGAICDVFAVLPAICGKVCDTRLNEKLRSVKMPDQAQKSGGFEKRLLSAAQFLHDFLSVSAAGAVIVLISYRFNDGQPRAASVICFILGYCIYRITFRRFLLPLSELTGFCARYVLSFAAFFLLLPIRAAGYLLKKLTSALRRHGAKNMLKRFTLRKKKELFLSAELFGCLEQKELSEYGKKKNKFDSDICNNRDAGFVRDTDSREYNAVQSKAPRGRKA